jgi:hypothetical protein
MIPGTLCTYKYLLFAMGQTIFYYNKQLILSSLIREGGTLTIWWIFESITVRHRNSSSADVKAIWCKVYLCKLTKAIMQSCA